LHLAFLFNAVIPIGCSPVFAQEQVSGDSTGWEERLEQLRAVPYVGLSDEEVQQEDTGVEVYDPQRACPGYNLYCVRSQGAAYLMDMSGRHVHKWTYRPRPMSGSRHAVMNDHVIMLENGDAVILKNKEGIARVGWNSELLWDKDMHAHHDVARAPDGSFYVLIQELKEHRGLDVWFDVIVHLSADWEELDRWVTHERLDDIKAALDSGPFLDTALDEALAKHPEGAGGVEKRKHKIARRYRYDYFHANTITVLPETPLAGTDDRFRPGNLLVCFRNVDQIAVLDQASYDILWSWGADQLEGPHHPTMLQNGNILVFNNGVKRTYSSVVELNPLNGEIVWEYQAKVPRSFYTFSRGSSQRLPNGNTFICVSDKARAFEVTNAGEVVWKWQNPVMVGNHSETFYRMIRLPGDQIDGLIENHEGQIDQADPSIRDRQEPNH
jgi:hypothetical protein